MLKIDIKRTKRVKSCLQKVGRKYYEICLPGKSPAGNSHILKLFEGIFVAIGMVGGVLYKGVLYRNEGVVDTSLNCLEKSGPESQTTLSYAGN